VKIIDPPVEGRANKALIALSPENWGCEEDLRLFRETGRAKTVAIRSSPQARLLKFWKLERRAQSAE